MKQIEIVQTRKEEADKRRGLKFIEEQISQSRRAMIQYEMSGDTLSQKTWEKKNQYWNNQLTEKTAVDEVVLLDQNEIIAEVSDTEIVTKAQEDSQTFIEGLEYGVVSAFISEEAYYKYVENGDPENKEYSNEEIEANVNALALAIRALPEAEYLEAMQSIHRGIER